MVIEIDVGDSVYLIKPKEALRQLHPEAKGFDWFLTTVIWPMGGREVRMWKEDDYQLHAKLTFLLNLYTRWQNTPNPVLREFVNTLFGELPLKVQTFDRWWDIEEGALEGGLRNLLTHVKPDELKLIGKTGNTKIDKWLEFSVEMAKWGQNRNNLSPET